MSNHVDDNAAAVEAASDEETYTALLDGAQEIAAINETLRTELKGIDGTLRYVQAKLDQQTAYSETLQELLQLREQLDTARQLGSMHAHTEPAASTTPATAFSGHEGRECGEHRPAGGRAWCFGCSEWCSFDTPCGGCERPYLHDELERAQAELTMWRARFGEPALREHVARAERDVSAFEASQELLRCAAGTINDLRARLAVLPEWQCPQCGATTRARMADTQKQPDGE